ncbi:MAG: tandem-95 repeat protein [Acidobacteriia bacterium]|nr:tandem-95 repeat protein [Terriglobia bacterium]
MVTGPAANANPATNPIKAAYNLYCSDGKWCDNTRPAWSQVAIMYAVRGGIGTTFSAGGMNGTTVVWDSTHATPGRNIWSQTPNSRHAYLLRLLSSSAMANIINPLVQAPPSPPNNHAPIANSQSVTSNGGPVAIGLTASDQDGNPLTFAIVSNPSHGVLTGSAPNVTYTPNAGFAGSDSFRFKANDGRVDSNTATVTITVSPAINHAPVANSQSVTSNGSAVAITLVATDQDGNSLAYAVVTNPANGGLTGTAPNVTYTPAVGFAGTDSFTFRANDGQLDSNIATVTITVLPLVNHAPIANSQSVTSPSYAVPITLTATDPDGNPLTYATVSNPTHGTLTGTPPNLTYTPTAGFLGTDGFTFKANDAQLDSNIATVTITVILPPPLQEPVQPVNIIVDSDLASDADDVGGQALLWALANRGETRVLALITSSVNDYSAPTAWAIANYFGQPSVPIGAYHGNIPGDYGGVFSYFTQQIATNFGKPGDTRANYPDAVTVYRQALAGAADGSVYIVAGGYYQPLKALLQSGPDAISPLTGVQLVSQKVKRMISAAGKFPGPDIDQNFLEDPDGASYVFAHWPTEIISSGYENGWDVVTGPAANADPVTNPIKQAYNLYCGDGQWCNNMSPAWTQVAMIYAVRGGIGLTFSVGGLNGSTVVWDSTQAEPGRNIWSQTPNSQHAYLLRLISDTEMADIINPLLQQIGVDHPPVADSQTVSTSGSSIAITLTAHDLESNPLTYSIITGPSHGSLTGAPPNLTYTPVTGFAGNDSFTFKANDGTLDSNIATVTITVVVNSVPAPTITSAPAAYSNNASPTFAYSDTQPGVTFQCSLSTGADSYAPCTSPITYSSVANGVYTFKVTAQLTGVISSPTSYNFTVDTVAPTVTITAAPAAQTNNSSPSFSFTSEAGAVFVCSLNSTTAYSSCSSPQTYPGLADGSYTFRVKATDLAGNTGTPAVSSLFNIDTVLPAVTAPVASFTAGSTLASATATAAPMLTTWTASDNGAGLTKIEEQQFINGAAQTIASLSASTLSKTFSLTFGAVSKFQVRATDGASNVSAWAAGPNVTASAQQETASAIAYSANWSSNSLTNAFGRTVKRATTAGSTATFTFQGTNFAWLSTKASDRGQADVYLDGVKVATVDLYASSTTYRVYAYVANGLSGSVTHTVKVTVLSTRNNSSSGTRVDVDGFLLMQ